MPESVGPASLWRHLPGCFGCGGQNPAGLGIRFDPVEGAVEGTVTFGDRHKGAPGMAHGGVIVTLLDEVMGSVAAAGERRRVTASIHVDFRRPVQLGRPVVASAQITDRFERGYLVGATVAHADEPLVILAEGTARFVSLGDS